ncbi:DUF6919 domain-containing protein [Streptomyces lunaelactis]|uniref:DUF6919 domain-containing protein n=1 Tax=Streptomyces lunaelactis TaxID=1535768 RepID=UPI001584C7C0|nr:hypothetical protein [Streptomyces lunaelactis]NUL14497.1 hypothetical protein [Streptomyces lunaelactis]
MKIRLPWMSRADRKRWQSARTLADLGQHLAAWLEGDIKSWPGYQPNYGPDVETAELIPVLARLNRAGYITDSSQPGIDETEAGHHWRQRAAVTGFIDDEDLLEDLSAAAIDAGLLVLIHRPEPSITLDGYRVTRLDGQPHTVFGGYVSLRDLRCMWPVINRQAFGALAGAAQLTIVDPRWGSDDRLWRALDNAITHPAAA